MYNLCASAGGGGAKRVAMDNYNKSKIVIDKK